MERQVIDKKDQLFQDMQNQLTKKENEMRTRLQDELHETTKRTIEENAKMRMEIQLLSRRTEELVKTNKVFFTLFIPRQQQSAYLTSFKK